MAEQNRTPHTRTASYLAEPGEVHRVLLLYSGGLDTSVMLKWIQDEYEAEVVALTVNLGQPGEDYDVVQGKALQLGAVAAEVVDAREEFANDFVVPAIKANAVYGLGYPLFTALGRPLIAKLAVEYARKHGCDTIAHGCTGKGNDQVRIEATWPRWRRSSRSSRRCAAGRWGARRRSPTRASTASRSRAAPSTPPTRSTTTSGGARRRGAGSRSSTTRPTTTSSSSSPGPSSRPTSPRSSPSASSAACPWRSTASAWGSSSCSSAPPRSAAATASASSITSRTASSGLKVRDIYEVPAAAIILPAHAELERLVGTIHQNQFKGELDRKWAYLVYAGLWWEPLRSDLDAYMEAVNAQVTGTIGMKLFKGMARVVTRESPNAVYDAALSTFETSGGLFSQQASPGFIELWSLQSRMAHRLRTRDEG